MCVFSVHIRYEDEFEGRPVAFGIGIQRLSAETTDEAWNPAFISDQRQYVYKKVELINLCETIYIFLITPIYKHCKTNQGKKEMFYNSRFVR